MPYNIMTCSGFVDASEGIGLSFGSCFKAKLAIVILFFLVAFMRKWVISFTGIPFNFWIGIIGGIIVYLIPISIFGNFKIAFLIGLVGALVLGYFGAIMIGADEDES